MVEIYDLLPGSPADLAGIRKGDYLVSINRHDITDVLDYSFYLAEPTVRISVQRDGAVLDFTIEKDEYADIGLQFETFLMDHKQSCRNQCVFCFIDQLPRGMREPLYFKDDDSRLSFLQGNYVTLTNMSDRDIERIIRMKMSPINISVHTTNPALREKMMNNRFAGKINEIMRRFADAGISMNCQIVLCRHLNDGEELERTLRDLRALYPAVQSVSVVPAGLTAHREGLYPLEPFTPEECAAVIRRVERMAKSCFEEVGEHIFFCADEFYLKAGRPLHSERYYDGYPQLDDGVGLITSMKTEFDEALRHLDRYDLNLRRDVSIATGAAAYPFICSLIAALSEKCWNFHCNVYCIENRFFGPEITVAGLITGTDLREQLKGKRLGSRLFLPSVMLRADGEVFLDDVTPNQLEWDLDIPISFIDNDGAQFVEKLLTDH